MSYPELINITGSVNVATYSGNMQYVRTLKLVGQIQKNAHNSYCKRAIVNMVKTINNHVLTSNDFSPYNLNVYGTVSIHAVCGNLRIDKTQHLYGHTHIHSVRDDLIAKIVGGLERLAHQLS